MVLVYQVDNKFIRVGKRLTLTLTSDINKASIWDYYRTANSWKTKICAKYPNAQIKKCGLVVLNKK